ncbi:MAG: DNA mismatch repair protein MutS [Clostridia bacterium]|nr:DNA mismatch repair protein MutS [Clostridia bacterium]
MQTVTPMMQQYLDIKNQYDGYILMYRLGDFYECFYEDAIIASRELELTLTGRDCGAGNRAAMCGVPFHKADVYIGKLVEKGYKVAICEQMEDPKKAVGLVKRDIIRVVTPGTITDSSLLTEGKNNYLLAMAYGQDDGGLAVADVTTGQISATELPVKKAEGRIENEIGAYLPAEAVLNIPESEATDAVLFLKDRCHALVSVLPTMFDYQRSLSAVKDVFGEESVKLDSPELIMATGALIAYIKDTQKSEITFVKELNVYGEGQYLEIDLSTRRNLELTENMRKKEKRGSLLWVLDKTKTAMGARLLRSWVLKPLVNPVLIGKRQDAVKDILNDQRAADDLSEILSGMLDIERLTAKAVYGTANAKDLRAICQSIGALPALKTVISGFSSGSMREIAEKLDTLDDLYDLLSRAIVETPPYTVREGGMIAKGFDADLDYYREIKENAAGIMQSIEDREKELTGIRTLRVDYNKVFGYYIEVSKSFAADVPDRYVRKQTLTNCERYITQELKEMETTIFSADEKIVNIEFDIFTKLRETVCEMSSRLRQSADYVAAIDVYRSFAEVAGKNNYCCPLVDLSTDLIIKDGRHPVVEHFVTDPYFVPNDTKLDTKDNRLMMITGPNMAGKSTYMRQVALIVIMAQIGSFVPAVDATVGIVDKVFTRVGASDDLASGQSTFMLEMNEVANILKNASKRSLIVYDEVGRGTSTFDGMAIARAVAEYTASSKIGAKTLFATHYHELIAMEDEIPGVVNYNIAAKRRGDSITFLRKIVRGGTDDSYGIDVAKLAGVPNDVIKRARILLTQIEEGTAPVAVAKPKAEPVADLFTALTESRENEVCEKLRSTDLNTLTPIEALNVLFTLKNKLEEN